jgi:hypothetical protein
VTADIGITGADQPFVFVTTTVRAVQCMHTIVLDQLPNAHDDFGATRPVHLYADANTQVVITVSRFGSSRLPAIPKPELVVLSGRLV